VRGMGLLLTTAIAISLGCSSPPARKSDAVGALSVTALRDANPPGDTVSVLTVRPVENAAKSSAESAGKKPFNVLVLSGGGADGAYAAGVLAGWTETGTRPNFDVITGISTGALIGTLAFLGPERDAELRRFYTAVTDDDVFAKKSKIAALLSDSLADPEPLAKKVESMVDQSFLAAIAAEHSKGRRLYVGTTHLDARRLIVWDMGAIAARGRPEDVTLFRQVILASTAAPGFFPPVPIRVDVDGKEYEELHVDGGASAAIFFRPPQVTWSDAVRLDDRPLAGSNLYILVSGKLYAEPGRVERKLLPLVADSVVSLVSAQLRGNLDQLYAVAQATGMKYRVAAIPNDVPASPDVMAFDPTWMGRLYEAGRKQAANGKLWRTTPPGTESGEDVPDRTGPRLTVQPIGNSPRP
jgi:predicted acylesterase/phospholipase RssA